jgi:tRNA-(ms[2]io[6]A)-hydroxylase
MQLSIDVKTSSSEAWISVVMQDFNEFLKDHANCERKASAMAMSFVAKYPDRVEILPELIDTAIEELEHFKDVYAIMQERNILLPQEIGQDYYVKALVDACRSDKDGRFMDRLLVASVVECRGAERFRMVYEALDPGSLKQFYHRLWASEAKHGHIFVKMALNYFDQNDVYRRLDEWMEIEGKVLASLPIKPALH